MTCLTIETIHLLGQKWSVFILQEIAQHKEKGFNVLYKRLYKVSPKVLTERLHDLERLGLIEKVIKNRNSSYTLTKKGEEMYGLFESIRNMSMEKDFSCPKSCVDCPKF